MPVWIGNKARRPVFYLSKLLGNRIAGHSQEGSQSSTRQVCILVTPVLVRVIGVLSRVVGDHKASCTLGAGKEGMESIGQPPTK